MPAKQYQLDVVNVWGIMAETGEDVDREITAAKEALITRAHKRGQEIIGQLFVSVQPHLLKPGMIDIVVRAFVEKAKALEETSEKANC